ncbi:hypothetical protein DFH09DRAFT_1314805 [Mycena vulgaris]|nr:hypothetical protein DFH09DRAFT_1314805 [Mycena vulgaris]
MNSTLNNPRGTMSLRGIFTQESFVFKIIRQSPDGRRTIEPLPPPEVTQNLYDPGLALIFLALVFNTRRA